MPVAVRQMLRIGAKEVLAGRIRAFFVKPSRAFVHSTTPQESEEKKMPTSSLVLKYTKVVPEAYPPTKGSVKAAGYDLKSAFDCVVPARGKALVDTGIKIQLPEGCYGRIAPRSGLAVKNFIDVGAGVVDEDYRGVLKVVLFNHSDTAFEVKSGDRIAQLICERIYYPDIEEVQELSETARGEGGFGSTGTN
ncbi:deoxyuridine 5'-triphosphate nucleotidohydrolase [Tribolium castaneum]|uniref:Deoxyuridine 5'-triphosphate nucleotidohydrolase n=1 Tax=Tribolium castaneum TaxID=7070 RepID=D6WT48_TRICA|nr:PREDICTED: deoxyuridine 5'-triphosphate nucleotidohydrolase [Tribolium castaneum]EFA05862.1 Deoxyuridine 5'-triphosphate nucleotidohydrolase-like Protein [Tribolium castaneum]|eukprot:XP_973701.1 PREDICTED: deoxyuridine 5'-triphosphate nucleotidohydrolase [Tribolium castaneum]